MGIEFPPEEFQDQRTKTLQSESPKVLRVWVGAAIEADSHLNRLYRIQRAPIDADLVAIVAKMRSLPTVDVEQMLQLARPVWRFLMERFAIVEAPQVVWHLVRHETRQKSISWSDGMGAWFWAAYRWFSCMVPRLMIAILVGFGIFSGSSALVGLAKDIAGKPLLLASTVAVCFGFVAFLAFVQVQQRVGSRIGLVLVRASILVGLGAAYVLFGLVAYAWCEWFLYAAVTPKLQLLAYGAFVLALSFAFQIFWQDRSLGTPL